MRQPQRVEGKMNKSLRNITMTMDKRIKDPAEFEIQLQKRIESMGANIDTRCFERFCLHACISHCLYRILDSKKTSRSQFSVPGLQEIHRNLKQQKILILAMAFLENPLFVLFPA